MPVRAELGLTQQSEGQKRQSPRRKQMECFIEENSAAPETFDAFRDFIEKQTLYGQWEAQRHELRDEHPDSVTAWDEWKNTIQWVNMRKNGTTAEAKAYARAFGKADELWHRYHKTTKWVSSRETLRELNNRILQQFSTDFSNLESVINSKESA